MRDIRIGRVIYSDEDIIVVEQQAVMIFGEPPFVLHLIVESAIIIPDLVPALSSVFALSSERFTILVTA